MLRQTSKQLQSKPPSLRFKSLQKKKKKKNGTQVILRFVTASTAFGSPVNNATKLINYGRKTENNKQTTHLL